MRRSTCGDEERRAQSRGEWPGERITAREGLVGMALWEGGGARVEEPGCRGCWGVRREGRGDGRGLAEGRGARDGGPRCGVVRLDGRGGGGIMEVLEEGLAARGGLGAEGVSSESVNVGTASLRAVAGAFGVVSGEVSAIVGFETRGGGGGGMSWASRFVLSCAMSFC